MQSPDVIERMRRAGPGGRRGARRSPAPPCSPASPPTSSTPSATRRASTAAATRARSTTTASPSRCARRSTRSSATASPTTGRWSTATSATSTSRSSSTASTATPTPRSSSARSTPRAGGWSRSPASAWSGPSRRCGPASRSPTSGGRSRSTPRATASAWSAASSATASASSSTPTCTCPHYYEPRLTRSIEEGMTFTIEPMITMGAWEHDLWDDGWTAVTVDRRRTAQFEHTLVVTADGCDVLTAPRGCSRPRRQRRYARSARVRLGQVAARLDHDVGSRPRKRGQLLRAARAGPDGPGRRPRSVRRSCPARAGARPAGRP